MSDMGHSAENDAPARLSVSDLRRYLRTHGGAVDEFDIEAMRDLCDYIATLGASTRVEYGAVDYRGEVVRHDPKWLSPGEARGYMAKWGYPDAVIVTRSVTTYEPHITEWTRVTPPAEGDA